MKFGSSDYLEVIYQKPVVYKDLINKLAVKLHKLREKTPFDAIAFRGTSGAAFAYPLSALLDIPLICVRKEKESSHGSRIEASPRNIRRYIILDDFISTGDTVRAIIKEIDDCNKWADTDQPAKCVGVALYCIKYGAARSNNTITVRKEQYPIFGLS